MKDEPSNPAALDYAAPERRGRGRLVMTVLLLSLLHLIVVGLLMSLPMSRAANECLACVLTFPQYALIKVLIRLRVPIGFDPSLPLIALTLLTSVLYGTVITYTALMVRQLLR